MQGMDPGRLVFVGGLHRSGTTPLARALAQHQEISGLSGTGVAEDEGQHLQDVYPRIRSYGGMGRFASDDRAHLTETSPLVSVANRERLLRSWAPYWDLDRRLLLEKSPGNLIMGRFLQTMFPGSALVLVMRHPVVVALAMQKWNPVLVAGNGRRRVSLPGLVEHWLQAHEHLRADAAQLDRLHVLRYEDLIDDPATRVADLADLLDLASPVDTSDLRRGRSDRYAREWEAMRTGAPWKRRARRLIEERYGDRLARYGYDVGDVTSAQAWAGIWPR